MGLPFFRKGRIGKRSGGQTFYNFRATQSNPDQAVSAIAADCFQTLGTTPRQ
jgi:hypothetical protein